MNATVADSSQMNSSEPTETVLKKEPKKVFLLESDYSYLRTFFVSFGCFSLVALSYVGLANYLVPMIIAGTMTLSGYLLACVALACVWTGIFYISSKYLRQYVLARKGKVRETTA